MGYRLGVDLGTTFTAAAVTHDDRAGRPELVTLGDDAPEVPTVVFLREDGSLVVGEVASSRGRAAPHRVAREFKRWLGDRTPVLLAGTPYSPHALLATVLRRVVARVAEQEGGPADAVVVTHPANWGPYKRELLQQVVTMADVPDAILRPEPVAAAMGYASLQRLAVGDVVAVYDLGGGTFDAAVVTRAAEGFAVVGEPAGVEQLGGVDFDDALFTHVLGALGPAVTELDPDDEAVLRGLTQLRVECTTAKVRLSTDVEWVVPVGLPGLHTTVRVTRAELEDLIRPAITETLAALHRAMRSAGVEPEALSRVLLAGGSSAIPLVSEMLSADLGRPVAVDAPAKHLVALGAALDEVPLPPLEVGSPAAPASGGTGTGPEVAAAEPRSDGGRARRRTVSRAPRPRPSTSAGRRAPSRPTLVAGVLGALAVALAVVPVADGGTPAALVVNGRSLADGAHAPLRLRDPASLVVEPRGAVDAVAVDLLGRLVGAEHDDDGTWDLTGHQLVAGAVPVHATVDGEPVRFVLAPESVRWQSLPAAAALVAALALLAYGESLLGPLRRGRRAGVPRFAALTLIGAGLGLVVGVAGWVVGPPVLSGPRLATCAVLGAAATAAGVTAVVRTVAGRRPAVGGAARPVHRPPSTGRDDEDVPRGASRDPDSR